MRASHNSAVTVRPWMRACLGRQKKLSVRHLYWTKKRLGCAIRPFFTPLSVFLVLVDQTSHWPATSAKKKRCNYVDWREHRGSAWVEICQAPMLDAAATEVQLCPEESKRAIRPNAIVCETAYHEPCYLMSLVALERQACIYDLPSARVQDLSSCPYKRAPYRNTSRQVC